jgi:hypothetical protein
MARMPTRPDEDAGAASDVLAQYVDAEFVSPPNRYRRAKDVTQAQQSAAEWAKWVAAKLRASLDEELQEQQLQTPRDDVRIAALQAALDRIKGW